MKRLKNVVLTDVERDALVTAVAMEYERQRRRGGGYKRELVRLRRLLSAGRTAILVPIEPDAE